MIKKHLKGLAAGLIMAAVSLPSVFAGSSVSAESLMLPPLTLTDILKVKNCIINQKKPTPFELALYDINNDGTINVMDLSRIINLIIYDKQVPSDTIQPSVTEPVTSQTAVHTVVSEPETTSVIFTETVPETTTVPEVTSVPENTTTAPVVTTVPETTTAPPAATIFSDVTNKPSSGGKWPSSAEIKVESILQNPELPTGCELTTLTMLLNHSGFETDKISLMKYMPMSGIYTYDGVRYGPDFRKVYPGNPTGNGGYGCYTPCMVTTASEYFRSAGIADWYLEDITGSDFNILLNYTALGKPVMVWATIGLIEPYDSLTWVTPEKTAVTWRANEHTMLLTGYDKENDVVYVNDPLKGSVKYPLKKFKLRYDEMGRYAAVLMKNGEEADVLGDAPGPQNPPSGPPAPPVSSDTRFKVGDSVYYTGEAYYSSKGGNAVDISGEYTISEIIADESVPYRVRLGTVGWVSWDVLVLNNTFDYEL